MLNLFWGPISPKSVNVAAYLPIELKKDDKLPLFGESHGNGAGALFSSQKMALSFPFDKMTTDIVNGVIKSTTGIPVFITTTFLGLTPPAGFKVIVNWDQTYKHFSENTKFKAEASYFGMFSASYQTDKQKIYDELINNKCIDVKAVTGENFTIKDLDTYLQPILNRLNQGFLQDMAPPPQVSAAVAENPSAKAKFFSAGYSQATKEATNKKSGKEVINFYKEKIVKASFGLSIILPP